MQAKEICDLFKFEIYFCIKISLPTNISCNLLVWPLVEKSSVIDSFRDDSFVWQYCFVQKHPYEKPILKMGIFIIKILLNPGDLLLPIISQFSAY